MDFFKRIVILKNFGKDERIKGSAKITVDNGEIKANFELINALNLPFNKMTAIICINDDVFYKTVNNATLFSAEFLCSYKSVNGVSVLVVSEDEFLLLYGESGSTLKTFNDLLFLYKNKGETNKTCDISSQYDDEKIATENYYEAEFSNGLFTKNDGITTDACGEKTTKKIANEILQNETCDCECKIAEFYIKNQTAILKVMSTNTAFTGYNEIIPESQFVKVDYGNQKHYIFGIIKELNNPKYVCYGVPGVYNEPPSSFKENGKFIPLETNEPIKSGYYIIFQSAINGKIL